MNVLLEAMRLWYGETSSLIDLIKADAAKSPVGPWGVWAGPEFTGSLEQTQGQGRDPAHHQ